MLIARMPFKKPAQLNTINECKSTFLTYCIFHSLFFYFVFSPINSEEKHLTPSALLPLSLMLIVLCLHCVFVHSRLVWL